jgi:predicted HNH restriction endonuclease
MTKTCSSCKEVNPLTEFYSNGFQPTGAKKYKSKCKQCQKSYDRTKFRNTISEIMGGYCCKICGYNKCLEAIEFHHIDPALKEWKLSELLTHKKETIETELSKGILVCANCHREVHYGFHQEYLLK